MKLKYTIPLVLLALFIAAAVALNSTSLSFSAPFEANVGDNIPFTAQLTDENGPLTGELVDFTVEGSTIGTIVSDENGEASLLWQPSEAGYTEVGARYQGSPVYASSEDTSAVNVLEGILKEEQTCQTILWQEDEPTAGTCSVNDTAITCSDFPVNLSCSSSTYERNYTCMRSNIVTKSREECVTTGYTIADRVQLSTSEYTCSATEQGSDTVVICDSRFDGDGNGQCAEHGGETCLRYIVHADGSYELSERNSGLEFVAASDKFFLEKPIVEVLP